MSLSNREEKLALGVFVVLALGGLSLATSRVRVWRATLWEQEATVESREVEAKELQTGGALWEERRQWVVDTLPSYGNAGEARSGLVSTVQEAAKAHAVVLQSQKLIDPDTEGKPEAEPEGGPDRPEGFALVVTATGDLKDLVLWWQELLKPEGFRQINFLKLIPEDDNSGVLTCNVEIWQWYRLSSESPGGNSPIAP